MEVKIYVEGPNDLEFLGVYLQEILDFVVDDNPRDKLHLFKKGETRVELINLGGYTNLNRALIQEDIREDLEDEIQSLVILDADTNANDGGFGVRKTQVEAIQATVPFECFLMPNGAGDGDLETLLRNILVDEYQVALECFRNFNQCLEEANKQLQGTKFKGADEKTTLYKVFLGRLKNTGQNKFKDQTIWNLNHPYLDPLKTFLQTQLH